MVRINKEKIKKLAFLFTYLWLITTCCFYNIKHFKPLHLRPTHVTVNTAIIEKISNSTIALVRPVTIRSTNRIVYTAYCAGVWIDEKTILTAYHCVHNSPVEEEKDLIDKKINFVTSQDAYSNNRYPKLAFKRIKPGTVIAVNRNYDLALLKADGYIGTHAVSKISKKRFKQGMPVHVMGHTAGLTYTYSSGTISNERILKTVIGTSPVEVVQISAPVWRGNSGGGAFDTNGELVGICSFILRNVDSLAFFIHRDAIIEFIQDSKL